jgi:hypothetical protein
MWPSCFQVSIFMDSRIRPGHGRFAAAILTEGKFVVNQVDSESVRFGSGEAKAIWYRSREISQPAVPKRELS